MGEAHHAAWQLIAVDEITKQRGNRGVRDDRVPGAEVAVCSVNANTNPDGSPVLGEDLRDFGPELNAAAGDMHPICDGVGEDLGASDGDGEAPGRRGHREHIADPGAKSICRTDVGVQREGWDYPSRITPDKQAPREAGAGCREQSTDSQEVRGPEARDVSEVRERAEHGFEQSRLDVAVPPQQTAHPLGVFGVRHERRDEVEISREPRARSVGGWMSALDFRVDESQPRLFEVETGERRTRARERKKCRANIVNKAGACRLSGPQGAAPTPLVGFDHEHVEAHTRPLGPAPTMMTSGSPVR